MKQVAIWGKPLLSCTDARDRNENQTVRTPNRWPMSYGAFQEYYEREEYPNEEPSVISLVNGMCCLVSAISGEA